MKKSHLFGSLAVVFLVATSLAWVSGQTEREEKSYDDKQLLTIFDLDPMIRADGSDQTERIAAALEKVKRSRKWIMFPAGTYGISGPILHLKQGEVVKLCGEGRDGTQFLLLDDCSEPIIHIEGKPITKPPFGQHGSFKLRGLHFNGNGKRATWMSFQFSSYTDLEDIMVSATVGSAISAFQWWDGNLINCHFVRSGDPETNRAVLHVADAEGRAWEGYSNNITFTLCRFENNNALPIYLGAHARKMRFVSCKFDRSPVEHIVMRQADSNIIEACEFVHSKRSTIKLDQCSGILVNSSLIEASEGYGIEGINGTSHCVITGNGFGVTPAVKPNVLGNLNQALGGQGNVIAENASRAKSVPKLP
jgi:hypothetical protein